VGESPSFCSSIRNTPPPNIFFFSKEKKEEEEERKGEEKKRGGSQTHAFRKTKKETKNTKKNKKMSLNDSQSYHESPKVIIDRGQTERERKERRGRKRKEKRIFSSFSPLSLFFFSSHCRPTSKKETHKQQNLPQKMLPPPNNLTTHTHTNHFFCKLCFSFGERKTRFPEGGERVCGHRGGREKELGKGDCFF